MAGDIEAIEKVVWTYLDGLHEGDTTKLAQAFHEVSHLYSMEKGVVADLPRAKWLEFVAGRPSAKSRGLPRTDRIISIDLSGPETAFVKLECSIPPRYFTDYLLLLKLEEDGASFPSRFERSRASRKGNSEQVAQFAIDNDVAPARQAERGLQRHSIRRNIAKCPATVPVSRLSRRR